MTMPMERFDNTGIRLGDRSLSESVKKTIIIPQYFPKVTPVVRMGD
jgi:hypothetical protein